MEQSKIEIAWLPNPETHDYPAAASYLGLLYTPKQVKRIVAKLKGAKAATFKAKDIFRASGLSLLGVSNSHVEKDLEKIRGGTALSPVLLVADGRRLVIADGYHRICACYRLEEDAVIPCRIVNMNDIA